MTTADTLCIGMCVCFKTVCCTCTVKCTYTSWLSGTFITLKTDALDKRTCLFTAYIKSAQEWVTRVRACNSNISKPIVRAEFPASTKNRTLVTCTHSNINILRSLLSACYYFQYWWEILPCCNFSVVTRSCLYVTG